MRTRFVVLIALVGIAIMGCTSPATAEPQVVAAMSDNATVQPTVSLTPEPTETTLPTATIVATATASPTATTQATPTPAPTETSTPTATPEPTATERVPDLSKYGLSYDQEGASYVNEKGEYAGEMVDYILNGRHAEGILLRKDVVRLIMIDLNTPEAIANGKWVIPFPMDTTGQQSFFIETHLDPQFGYFIGGLSSTVKFTQPFLEDREVLTGGNINKVGTSSRIEVPEALNNGGKGRVFRVIRPYETGIGITGVKKFGDIILDGMSGELSRERIKFPEGTQAIVLLAPLSDPTTEDLNIYTKIMNIDGRMVFLAAK